MNNFMQLVSLLKSGRNLKDLAHELAKNSNNPIVNNLISQLDNGNQEEANKIINNLMQQNGMNEQLNQFKTMLGIK